MPIHSLTKLHPLLKMSESTTRLRGEKIAVVSYISAELLIVGGAPIIHKRHVILTAVW